MDRDEYLERYQQLSQQSERIRQRLSISSHTEHGGISPTESISPTSSPTRKLSTASSSTHHNLHHPNQAYSFPSTQAWPMPQAVPQIWKSSESEQVDEANLYEISHQIKVLLTDLLNCDSVRHDKMYRAWVQARLMDAEHELKRQRRRRSSAAQETMRTISLSQEISPIPHYRASF